MIFRPWKILWDDLNFFNKEEKSISSRKSKQFHKRGGREGGGKRERERVCVWFEERKGYNSQFVNIFNEFMVVVQTFKSYFEKNNLKVKSNSFFSVGQTFFRATKNEFWKEKKEWILLVVILQYTISVSKQELLKKNISYLVLLWNLSSLLERKYFKDINFVLLSNIWVVLKSTLESLNACFSTICRSYLFQWNIRNCIFLYTNLILLYHTTIALIDIGGCLKHPSPPYSLYLHFLGIIM